MIISLSICTSYPNDGNWRVKVSDFVRRVTTVKAPHGEYRFTLQSTVQRRVEDLEGAEAQAAVRRMLEALGVSEEHANQMRTNDLRSACEVKPFQIDHPAQDAYINMSDPARASERVAVPPSGGCVRAGSGAQVDVPPGCSRVGDQVAPQMPPPALVALSQSARPATAEPHLPPDALRDGQAVPVLDPQPVGRWARFCAWWHRQRRSWGW